MIEMTVDVIWSGNVRFVSYPFNPTKMAGLWLKVSNRISRFFFLSFDLAYCTSSARSAGSGVKSSTSSKSKSSVLLEAWGSALAQLSSFECSCFSLLKISQWRKSMRLAIISLRFWIALVLRSSSVNVCALRNAKHPSSRASDGGFSWWTICSACWH